jgi:hypothetical protein
MKIIAAFLRIGIATSIITLFSGCAFNKAAGATFTPQALPAPTMRLFTFTPSGESRGYDRTYFLAVNQRKVVDLLHGGYLPYEASPEKPAKTGRGELTKDEARAVTLYQRACDAGNDRGCTNLKRLLSAQESQRPNGLGASLSIPSPHAQVPPSSSRPPGMLDGVYVALAFGEVYRKLEHRYLRFFPDGTVARGLPDEGFDGFNLAAFAARSAPSLVGRYRADGKRIEIIWNDSPNNRWSVQRDEEGSAPRGVDSYVPACRCTGAKFSGVYDWGRNSIQFFPNGNFVDRGVADSMLFFRDSNMERPRVGQGVYSIRDYTLTLDYGGGRVLRKGFGAPAVQEKAQTFDWIAITGIHTLYRQGFKPAP